MKTSKPRQSKKGSTTGKKPKSAAVVAVTGKRAGTKRSDRRWIAPDGALWASKFEWEVYIHLGELLHDFPDWTIERCGPSDTLSYSTPVQNGRCTQCRTVCVVQDRTYTPDLALVHRVQGKESRRIYLETKGYFKGTKRNLFRQALKANPDIDIRLVAEANGWVTKGKSRLTDWAKRFKIPMYLWKELQLEELLK